jgi:hypothetical protein
VEECEILEAHVGLRKLNEGVEIAVGLLRGGDLGDGFINPRLELGVGMQRERVRRALDPLVNVRVRPERPAELSLRFSRGDLEIVASIWAYTWSSDLVRLISMRGDQKLS